MLVRTKVFLTNWIKSEFRASENMKIYPPLAVLLKYVLRYTAKSEATTHYSYILFMKNVSMFLLCSCEGSTYYRRSGKSSAVQAGTARENESDSALSSVCEGISEAEGIKPVSIWHRNCNSPAQWVTHLFREPQLAISLYFLRIEWNGIEKWWEMEKWNRVKWWNLHLRPVGLSIKVVNQSDSVEVMTHAD